MRWLLVFLLLHDVACSSKQPPTTTGSGNGGSGGVEATGCEGARAKVEALYRAEATANKEPADKIAESVSDNTTMVMNDCAKQPDKTVACINKVSTSAELEKQCLIPLDNEGTEGEALRK